MGELKVSHKVPPKSLIPVSNESADRCKSTDYNTIFPGNWVVKKFSYFEFSIEYNLNFYALSLFVHVHKSIHFLLLLCKYCKKNMYKGKKFFSFPLIFHRVTILSPVIEKIFYFVNAFSSLNNFFCRCWMEKWTLHIFTCNVHFTYNSFASV